MSGPPTDAPADLEPDPITRRSAAATVHARAGLRPAPPTGLAATVLRVHTVAMSEPRVTIYSTWWCPYCHAAKRFLDGRHVAWREVDLSRDPDALAALKQRVGHRTVPLIFVGHTFVGGYTELRALDARGELSPLLAAAAHD